MGDIDRVPIEEVNSLFDSIKDRNIADLLESCALQIQVSAPNGSTNHNKNVIYGCFKNFAEIYRNKMLPEGETFKKARERDEEYCTSLTKAIVYGIKHRYFMI